MKKGVLRSEEQGCQGSSGWSSSGADRVRGRRRGPRRRKCRRFVEHVRVDEPSDRCPGQRAVGECRPAGHRPAAQPAQGVRDPAGAGRRAAPPAPRAAPRDLRDGERRRDDGLGSGGGQPPPRPGRACRRPGRGRQGAVDQREPAAPRDARGRPCREPDESSRGFQLFEEGLRERERAASRAAGPAPDQRRQPHEREQPPHERPEERAQPRLHGRRREHRGLPGRDGPEAARLPAQRTVGRHRLPRLLGRGPERPDGRRRGLRRRQLARRPGQHHLQPRPGDQPRLRHDRRHLRRQGARRGPWGGRRRDEGLRQQQLELHQRDPAGDRLGDPARPRRHPVHLDRVRRAADQRGRAAADRDPRERDAPRHRGRRQHRGLQPVEHRGEPGARPRCDRYGREHLVPALRPDEPLPVRHGPGRAQPPVRPRTTWGRARRAGSTTRSRRSPARASPKTGGCRTSSPPAT